MSLRDLSARTRRRLRLHGWLLTLWCIAVGVATNAGLLHAAGLRSPAARYAICAVLMYAVGLVAGTRFWLARFSDAARREPGAVGRGDSADRAAFDAERAADAKRGGRMAGSLDWGIGLLDLGELSVFLLVPALCLLALGVVGLAGTAPVLLVDGLAGLLAEIAVQFVFGALLVRGVMRPRHHGEAFMHIVGKTWFVGVLLVVVSAAAGALLAALEPGAATIGDLFRR